MNRNSPDRSALFALIVLIIVWAYSWIVMKTVMQYSGPFQFAALRYLGGAIVLFALLVARRESLRPPPFKLTLAIGLCQTAVFQALAQWALVSGGAGHTSLLTYTMPFWAILLAWLFLSERPDRQQRIGIGLAAAGLICVMQPWQGFSNLYSAFLAVAGGIGWAMGVVLTKRMFELHAPSPLALTAWQMLLGAVALCLVAVLVPASPIAWTTGFILGLAYSIVLASSLAWFLWSVVVQRLPTTIASLSSLGVPVVAVLMAWVLLAERPGGMEWLGIVLIGAGLLAISGIGRRVPTASRHDNANGENGKRRAK